MKIRSDEAAHHGYADGQVPKSEQASGWKIFFIVSGTLCGLPVFILAAQIFTSLGFTQGLKAVILGGAITGTLSALSAYTGSRARAGLAVLADQAFGQAGSRVVKLIIAISLIGWFGVAIGVVGATTASALRQMGGWQVPALAIGFPMSIGIAAVTIFGAKGLERLGNILIPVTAIVLLLSVYLVFPQLDRVWKATGAGPLDFASCVSAVVGTVIVGVVIQPDYGRFIRRPGEAALGSGLSLGVVYPLILTASAIATLALGADEVISAMILLGFGLPALAVLLMGAWIETSASMYSASLSLANQAPRLSFQMIVGGVWLVGVLLVVAGAETVFIPFLMALGLALPPLAAVLILSHFLVPAKVGALGSFVAAACSVTGTVIGLLTTRGLFALTGLPVLDSILMTAVIFAMARFLLRRNASGSAEARAS
jgi:cytosine permease